MHLLNYAPGGTVNSRFDYTYNALGLETTEATIDGTWTYSYDADGQLIHAVFASTNSSIPNQDLAYSYDAMGNRIATVINGVTTAYTTNDMNEYTSVGGVQYIYDANGNLLSDGTNTYSYNSLNQLASVVGPSGTTNYTYNALGQRAASTTNGLATQYLIDPSGIGNVVEQYTGGGTAVADYTYGLGLTSQVTSSGSYYYAFDSLGSAVGISDGTGKDVNQYAYLPFGGSLLVSSTLANPFQFYGEMGVTTLGDGFVAMRARVFDPRIGRFMIIDPLRTAGGDSNLYGFVHNNPVSISDPSGLLPTGFLNLHNFFDTIGHISDYFDKVTLRDGSTSYGVVSGTGTLTVTGSHTFAAPVNETVTVQISHNLGYTTTATVSDIATVTSLGQRVQAGEGAGIGLWHNKNGQALISSFNGGSSSTTLADWLASTFPNLYGINAGTHNLTGMTNAQVAAFYLSLFEESGPKLDAQVLATALNVYATTLALGGTTGEAYGFLVDAYGLGARLYNVGSNGSAFSVPNNTTLNVYEILLAANEQAVKGVLYNDNSTLQNEALNVFGGINQTGGI